MTATGTSSGATRRRGGWIAVGSGAVIVLLAVAGLVGVLLVRPDGHSQAGPEPPPVVVEPAPEPVLAAAGDTAPLTPATVEAAIEELVGASELGGQVSASVVDLLTGEELYGRQAETSVVPASTIKLVTGTTALAARGPSYQIPTTAVAGDEPGEVVLVGGGDPTLAIDSNGFYPGAARLDLLATQVLSALGDTPVSKVTVDSTGFSGPVHGPWTSDIPGGGYVGPITSLMTDGGRKSPDPAQGMEAADRWEDPDLAAGEAFAALLGLDADTVVAREQAPAGATVLGEVTSPPMQRLVEIMLSTSDNVIAEALARQVALTQGEPASFEGAAAATAAALTELLGELPDGTVTADGSGLSRDNRISAGLLTDLLVAAATGPREDELGGVFSGLAVAGWSGTLAERYQSDTGQGLVRAKTGSLNGVDALAGTVVTAGGRPLAFAVLADQVPADHDSARAALDQIPATLATL